MPLRTRIFILVTIVVLIVLGVSLLLIVKFGKKPAVSVPVSNQSTNFNQGNVVIPGTPATVIPQNLVVKPSDSAAVTENTVRQLAKIFVERFNTYSSDDIYQNIRDVQVMVTDEYWKKIGAPLSRTVTPPPVFVALTTKVMAITSSEVQASSATVLLKAQKISTNGALTSISNADYNVSLVKSGSNWLIANQTESK